MFSEGHKKIRRKGQVFWRNIVQTNHEWEKLRAYERLLTAGFKIKVRKFILSCADLLYLASGFWTVFLLLLSRGWQHGPLWELLSFCVGIWNFVSLIGCLFMSKQRCVLSCLADFWCRIQIRDCWQSQFCSTLAAYQKKIILWMWWPVDWKLVVDISEMRAPSIFRLVGKEQVVWTKWSHLTWTGSSERLWRLSSIWAVWTLRWPCLEQVLDASCSLLEGAEGIVSVGTSVYGLVMANTHTYVLLPHFF